MQVNTINSYSIDFGARKPRIRGKMGVYTDKSYRASNANKGDKYYKQYEQGVKNTCSASQGDLLSVTGDLNRLEHRFHYNMHTNSMNTKNIRSKKTQK